MSSETLDRYIPLYFALSALWISMWVVASIVYRRSRGKPVGFVNVANPAFIERAASGRSNRTWWTRLGGASRCLVVAVAEKRLIIRPRFPFNLMFLPEVYGLEYDVPADHVTHTELRGTAVRLEFRDADNGQQDVTLYLRNPGQFLQALGKPSG